ncbi:MAG: ankyrin repeat domain-containing protein [Tatlockia sp.]|nr:ankyrin repeat domain-containing protein [Tatlockia sp.]
MKSREELQAIMATTLEHNDVEGLIKIINDALQSQLEINHIKQAICLLSIHPSGNNILHYAVENNAQQLENILINENLIPATFYNRKNGNGDTPLVLAVKHQNYNYAKAALKNGANPNILTSSYIRPTPLHIASHNCDIEMIKLLLAHKDICVPKNLLFFAIDTSPFKEVNENDRTNIVKLLIKNGCNILVKYNDKTLLEIMEHNKNNLPHVYKYDEELFATISKEIQERTRFHYSAPLLFWASKNDNDSSVYGLPQDCIQYITNATNYL